MITDIIKHLQSSEHYGVGEFIEIAKGKNEMIFNYKDLKRKIKRQWLLRKL